MKQNDRVAGRKGVKRRRLFGVFAFTLITVIIYIWWTSRQFSFSPWRLRGAKYYILFSPGIFRYCFVRSGSSEETIVKRLGPSPDVIERGDPAWRRYIDRLRQDGWVVPSRDPEGKVLIYTEAVDIDMVIAFYFIDQTGRLQETFVAEK